MSGARDGWPSRVDVVIVGGGITGLAAAHLLGERAPAAAPVRFRLLEASPRLGGPIESELDDGYLFEAGPDSLVTQKPAGLALCRRLGLETELVEPAAASGGFEILHRGRLHPVPEGFQLAAPGRRLPMLRSQLFSWRGKLRLLLEPLMPPKPPAEDESLASFVRRRSGQEVLERVVEPFFGGLYTADVERLSVAATAPRLLELERRAGSLTRALASAERPSRSGVAPVVSLRAGMGTLVDRLRASLYGGGNGGGRGDQAALGTLETGSAVESIDRDVTADCWRLAVRCRGELETVHSDAVVLAAPAYAGARLLRDADPGLAAELETLEYASCATLSLAYRARDVSRPPASFGFFVTRGERHSLLAASYASRKFAERAPADRLLVRLFLGGALNPQLLERDDAELVDIGHRALVPLLGLDAPPVGHRLYRHWRSMPQFPVGYPSRVARMKQVAATRPGLVLAGSSVGAFGLPDCIASGEEAAAAALAWLGRRERAAPLSLATP